MKRAWITGGGSGIGAELALALASEGWAVVISGRNQARLDAIAGRNSTAITTVCLDVTDHAAVLQAVDGIEREQGPIDLAVLNAGDYEQMSVGDFSAELSAKIMKVNYLGVVNGLDALLPRMGRRRSGHIAIVASLAGYRGLPLAAAYGPSKAALINLAESLRLDCEKSGIKLQLVNPGFVATPLTAKNEFEMPGLITAKEAAQAFLSGLKGDGFEIVFPKGFARRMEALRLLPYRLFFWAMRRVTGV